MVQRLSSSTMVGRVVSAGRRDAAAASPSRTYHHSTSFLGGAVKNLNLALVILNVEQQHRSAPQLGGGAAARFQHAWDQSAVRICADGAANRLYDSLTDADRQIMLPNVITGDLDSLRDDVAQFYEERGVLILREAEQDTHDFEKCLRWLERNTEQQQEEGDGDGGDDAASTASRSSAASAATAPASASSASSTPASAPALATPLLRAPLSVVAYGAFGGRLDQQMANLNMAYSSFSSLSHLYLVSDESLAFVLRPGKHTIEVNEEEEDGTCGLIPLGGRCERVVTSGLRWDLDGDRPLEFGALLSSSNEFAKPTITIETDAPLLWTTGLRRQARSHQ